MQGAGRGWALKSGRTAQSHQRKTDPPAVLGARGILARAPGFRRTFELPIRRARRDSDFRDDARNIVLARGGEPACDRGNYRPFSAIRHFSSQRPSRL